MRFLAIMGLFASLFGGGCKQAAQPQQSTPQQPQMSQRLADIAFFALDHGIYSIQDGDGPLVPFVMSEQADGKRRLDRYVSEAKVGGSAGTARGVKASVERECLRDST
jgi:hypothetical protein